MHQEQLKKYVAAVGEVFLEPLELNVPWIFLQF
jgi:hypothetical protein